MTAGRPAVVVAVLLLAGSPARAQSVDTAPADPSSLFSRGAALLNRGDALGSRPLFRRAVELAEAAGDRALMSRALGMLAEAQGELGDWAGMLDYAQRAYDVAPEPEGPAMVVLLNRRGRVYQELRERDSALASYQASLQLAEAIREARLAATAHAELGLALWRLDRDEAGAVAHYDEAIARFRALGDDFGLIAVLNNSGNVFRRPGGYAEAERRYGEGLAIARRRGFEDAFLLKNMGIVLRETGRRDAAAAMLMRAVEVADAKGNGRIRWQGRMELGTFYRDVEPDRAAAYFESALTVLEAQNGTVLLEGFRAGALSGALTIYDDPYDLYLDLLLRGGREREAFRLAERARARAFLDQLAMAREQVAAGVAPDLVDEERRILESISRDQAELRSADLAAERRRALTAGVDAAEQRLLALRARISSAHPGLGDARYPRLLAVEDVQARLLGEDEVLIEYFLGAESSTVWMIARDRLEVRRLPARAAVEQDVRELLAALSTPQGDYAARSHALGAQLLPFDLSAERRLLIVPHGMLHYLPFEALRTPDGAFLIERHTVAYAPSASSLAFLRGRPTGGAEVVAVGNPVIRGSDVALERGAGIDRVGLLKPLAFSGLELRQIGEVYGRAARVVEGADATEAALNPNRLANAAVIHFATHGLVDEERPERSGLALTASPPESDGVLQMREVFGLRLTAALVTLSACQTALGKQATGEGMVGLARSFFYAGAGAVLASLWNVDDRSTAELMRPFYEALADGARIDDAARRAKLALIGRGGPWAHPYHWAPFIVTGHAAATVPVRADRPLPTWAVAGGILALVLTAVLVWRRVR
ncbi:MAG: CHAT domain-containing protein [Acidobacteriota bacterium]